MDNSSLYSFDGSIISYPTSSRSTSPSPPPPRPRSVHSLEDSDHRRAPSRTHSNELPKSLEGSLVVVPPVTAPHEQESDNTTSDATDLTTQHAQDDPFHNLHDLAPTQSTTQLPPSPPIQPLALHSSAPPSPPAPSSSSFPTSALHSPSPPHHQQQRDWTTHRPTTAPRRARSSTNGSASDEHDSHSHTSSQHHAESLTGAPSGGGLVMPRLHLRGREDSRSAGSVDTDSAGGARWLILGKTSEKRTTFARLLSGGGITASRSNESFAGDTDGGMTSSFLSAKFSERSRTSSSRQFLSEELEDLVEELPHRAQHATFVHPAHDDDEPLDLGGLVKNLALPLEALEAKVNPTFPTTNGLLELVARVGSGDIEASFMLFSSPPTPSELALARTISQLIPLIPVLILPPSPTSRPQKTAALVSAVSQQLNLAGVRWIAALDTTVHSERKTTSTSSHSGANAPLYLLPHDLFTLTSPSFESGASSANASSLSSSQELLPPSPTFTSTSSMSSFAHAPSSRSSSPASTGDLGRLRLLVNSVTTRERVRRMKAISFLDWREVEIAARGECMVEVETLPKGWGERMVEDGEREGAQGEMDFSRRVAERRASRGKGLGSRRKIGESEADSEGDEEESSDEDAEEDGYDSRRASIVTDPTTPRCNARSLPFFAPLSSSPTPHQSQSLFRPTSPSSSTTSTSTRGSTPQPQPLLSSSLLLSPPTDPFHLPHLLHLVGLRIRLSFLPLPVTAATSSSSKRDRRKSASTAEGGAMGGEEGAQASWLGTVAVVAAVFLVGYGAGQAVGADAGGWRGVMKGVAAVRGW